MSKDHHIIPFKVYLIVYISLLVLTIVTVWISRIDLGINILNVFCSHVNCFN